MAMSLSQPEPWTASNDICKENKRCLMLYCYTTVPGKGEGWDPANVFQPATLFMYVPVPSQEPVIQWLSFVQVLYICSSFIFYINLAVSFLV